MSPLTELSPNVRRSNSAEERSKMLNKLKHQFSVKSNKSDNNDHPQRHSIPATRRPMNPPTVNNPFKDMSGEAPPPYSPAPPTAPAPAAGPVAQANATSSSANDDPYSFLSTFDTIFLIDDSGSMAGGLWRETSEALKSITPVCTAHDEDGIDIYFLNSADSPRYHNVKRADTVEEIFRQVRPGGGTPTGQRLNAILKPYLRKCEANLDNTKPINIICITDGEPSDDVESVLIAAAKKLDRLEAPAWQVGVQFFQVGRDEEARKHLKQLDDDLAEIAGDEDLRDIVDTVPFTSTSAEGSRVMTLSGEGVLKVVLGSVNRRLDRKKCRDLHC